MNSFPPARAFELSDLYAGGAFTTAGGSAATNIAKWNGSSWSQLGSGLNSTVYALAVSGSDLYAGSNFATVRGNAATIAEWNGRSWPALGSGRDGRREATYMQGADSRPRAGGCLDILPVHTCLVFLRFQCFAPAPR